MLQAIDNRIYTVLLD